MQRTSRMAEAAALELSELLADYVTETRRGAPRRPDQYYVEKLLSEPEVEAVGAWDGEDLVGFAIFFDLPEVVTGRRMGQVDELFVCLQHRRKGIATLLLHALEEEGRRHAVSEVRARPCVTGATSRPPRSTTSRRLRATPSAGCPASSGRSAAISSSASRSFRATRCCARWGSSRPSTS